MNRGISHYQFSKKQCFQRFIGFLGIMFRECRINVTGDAMVATVVAKTEGELTDVKKAA